MVSHGIVVMIVGVTLMAGLIRKERGPASDRTHCHHRHAQAVSRCPSLQAQDGALPGPPFLSCVREAQ